jgi:hypothetical protein
MEGTIQNGRRDRRQNGSPDRRKARSGTSSARQGVKPQPKDYDLLEWFVDYEIRSAARYRRFATIVMMSPMNQNLDIPALLADIIRHSDEFFGLSLGAAILMGETDSTGALAAIDRYKARCNGDADLRFALASYPTDGTVTSELISTVRRRLNEARIRQYGAVVSTG